MRSKQGSEMVAALFACGYNTIMFNRDLWREGRKYLLPLASSILFGALIVAGREIQPSGLSMMIQGIILFFIISSDVLLRYRVKLVRGTEEVAV